MRRPTFIDLFSGAGGWTSGLKAAGLQHVCGVELDLAAVQSYTANHGRTVIAKDVRQVTMADFQPFLSGLSGLDLLVASPPCQTFSMARNNAADVKEDDLYLQVVRIATLLKPEMVIVENVPGFLKIAGQDLMAKLKHLGYSCRAEVLLATDFEVPQIRKRTIIVAQSIKNNKNNKNNDEKNNSLFKPVLNFDATIDRLLETGPIDPFYKMSPEKCRYYEARHLRLRGRVHFIDRSEPSHTVLASYYKSRGAPALLRTPGGGMRMLTELELARIQTFPDLYIFLGPHTRRCAQIGNAVPPRLAFHIGMAVKHLL